MNFPYPSSKIRSRITKANTSFSSVIFSNRCVGHNGALFAACSAAESPGWAAKWRIESSCKIASESVMVFPPSPLALRPDACNRSIMLDIGLLVLVRTPIEILADFSVRAKRRSTNFSIMGSSF